MVSNLSRAETTIIKFLSALYRIVNVWDEWVDGRRDDQLVKSRVPVKFGVGSLLVG